MKSSLHEEMQCIPSSSTNYIRFIVTCCCFIAGLLFSMESFAQIPAQCGNTTCSANDITIVRARLTDPAGNSLSCSSGQPITNAVLHLIVSAKTPRVGAFINCKLNISGVANPVQISNCFGVALSGNNNDLQVSLSNTSIPCGSSASLSEIFTSWGTGNTNYCPATCPGTPSKCRFVPGEVIIVETFPCAPASTTGPTNASKCDGATNTAFNVSFTAASNTNVQSVQWQFCATNCNDLPNAAWTNISTGGVNTVTTNIAGGTSSLAISSVTGLNGKIYRALITSNSPTSGQTCTTAPSATLTVNSPPTINAAYNAPACTENTFSVTLSSVQNGATYTIKDKDGNNITPLGTITGVNPSSPYLAPNGNNFSFTNIPCGVGYQVTASAGGCPSSSSNTPSNSCGVPGVTYRVQSPAILESQAIIQPTKDAQVEIKAPAGLFGQEFKIGVKAFPNPFNDRVKFVVTLPEAGNGSLEVVNMLGQKIKTVYQGYISAGSQTFEMNVPPQQRSSLIYILKVGSNRLTGKLLNSQ